MVWDIYNIVFSTITFLVIWSIFDYINFDNKTDYKRKRIVCYSSEIKFLIIIFIYLCVLFLYLVYGDVLEDNHFIMNLVLFLIPSIFFFRIYKEGVNNKYVSDNSRLDSFTYVTYLVGWTILGPFSVMWWLYIIISYI